MTRARLRGWLDRFERNRRWCALCEDNRLVALLRALRATGLPALALALAAGACAADKPRALLADPEYVAARACGEIGRWYAYNAQRAPAMTAGGRAAVRRAMALTDAYCDPAAPLDPALHDPRRVADRLEAALLELHALGRDAPP